ELRARVGVIACRVRPREARFRVDGELRECTSSVLVDPGERTLEVEAEGYRPTRHRVRITPGVEVDFRMELVPLAEVTPPRDDGRLLYRPALYAHLALRFDEEAADFVQDVERHRVWFPLDDRLRDHADLQLEPPDVLDAAPERAAYAPLPDWLDERKELAAAQKQVMDDVLRDETTGLLACPPLKLWSRADESAAAFRARCEEAVNDRVDAQVAKLRDGFEAKAEKLEEKVRKAEQKLAEASRSASARQTEELVNVGETLLSWFTGRRKSLTTAATRRRQSSEAARKADALEDDLQAAREALEALEGDLVEQMEAIRGKESKALHAIEERRIKLEKADVSVRFFGVLWVPVTRRV
ncbi:MAG TPA: PEGA domain-containing protein, partial [Myxococcota bacterium]|nr:PEGA domain-containing protein [Myxococcota bacterium]